MVKKLFNPEKSLAGEHLAKLSYPWEVLSDLEELIVNFGRSLDPDDYVQHRAGIWIHKTCRISSSASIGAPCIIGKNSEVRHAAFIRKAALIGEGCVIGNSTEIKNSVIFDGAQVPHFNYVGDSILGYRAHFGAGAVTSNVKNDRSTVRAVTAEGSVETGLVKLGAMVGDYAEIGCGCVLNPGTVIGRSASVYPLVSVRGYIPSDSICKGNSTVQRI